MKMFGQWLLEITARPHSSQFYPSLANFLIFYQKAMSKLWRFSFWRLCILNSNSIQKQIVSLILFVEIIIAIMSGIVDDWQGILQLWNVNMCLIRCCHHHPQTWKQHMAPPKFWGRKMSPKKTSGLLQRPLKAILLDHTVFVYYHR